MRLSRAILVMLLLHFVALGGFLASSALRDRVASRSSGESAPVLEAEDSHVPAKEESATARKTSSPNYARPSVHVVKPGETLTLIANENGVTLEALVAANGAETVTNGLRTGQELRLPNNSPDPSTANLDNTSMALSQIEGRPKTAQPPAPANAGTSIGKTKVAPLETGKIYVVAKGDNAITIAQKNKVSYEGLLKLNQIDDPRKLRPGQKLRLPTTVPSKPKPKQS